MQPNCRHDRATQDIGNIVELGHVNTRIPDQLLATEFYITKLGLTRDPYLVTGTDNMWVNVGRGQFHLPTGPAQVLNGVTGLVLPDLARVAHRLGQPVPEDGVLETMCPWGNRLRCHAPDPGRFGPVALGLAYVEIDAPPGSAEPIARFYRDILATQAGTGQDEDGVFATIPVGLHERLIYRETTRPVPAFDGHHIQITLADFSGPHRRLRERELITQEDNAAQYRFEAIIDLRSGEKLVTIEHEVRSMRHPMFARALVNRDPFRTNNSYAPGHEDQPWFLAEKSKS